MYIYALQIRLRKYMKNILANKNGVDKSTLTGG